jgi:hypothetical protein
MKIIKFSTFLLFLVNYCNSQDYFKIGIDYYNKGNYVMADSFLTMYVRQNPKDINAIYNRGIVRFYLHDTCTFCHDLYSINNPYEIDKQALDLYFNYCGKTDTIYYDKKFVESNKANSRFFEVIEYHKYLNQTTGKIHDGKRKFEVTKINFAQIKSFKTDIFAFYQMDSDSNKVYIITDTPPSFPEGDEALNEFIISNQYFQEAKTTLNLQGFVVTVELTIDKFGKIKGTKVINVRPQISKIDELSKYIGLIYKSLPSFNSGKLKGQNVDFKLVDNIRF